MAWCSGWGEAWVGEDPLPTIAECPTSATDGLATAIGNDQAEKPTPDEQGEFNRIVRSNCEDLDEAYRSAFLAEGEKIVGNAPKGRKAAYWNAFRKVYDRKATRAQLQRASAGAETLTSTMLAGTLTIGGFVIVALFGALLALLPLERLARAGGQGARSGAPDRADRPATSAGADQTARGVASKISARSPGRSERGCRSLSRRVLVGARDSTP